MLVWVPELAYLFARLNLLLTSIFSFSISFLWWVCSVIFPDLCQKEAGQWVVPLSKCLSELVSYSMILRTYAKGQFSVLKSKIVDVAGILCIL